MSRLHPISGCDRGARLADVVFLHGLGGDPFGTWRYGKDEASSWPHWLGEEFPEIAVWSLGYAASPSKWSRLLGLIGLGSSDSGYSMALPDRALQALDLMVQRGIGERPLMFVCHSLGGLLAKQILRKSLDSSDPRKKRVADRTRAVLFLATPHAGSALATLIDAFRDVFGATVSIDDLKAHDAHLSDLYDWYRSHAPLVPIETVTYFETRAVKGALTIVNPTSAHPGIGADPVGLDDDHLSIAKPRRRDDQVCGAARDLVRGCLLAAPPVAAVVRVAEIVPPAEPREIVVRLDHGQAAREPQRVPRELPPAAYEFFGRQRERTRLEERLRAGLSTAVVGPAGIGKTALAAKALAAVVGENASALERSPFPDGLVYLDLYTLRGEAGPAWNALANRVFGPETMSRALPRDRAAEACRGRRLLLIIEGGEDANGRKGRATITELLSVLSSENRWLLLTRDSSQAAPPETVFVQEALDASDAAGLLDFLTERRPLEQGVRQAVLELLEGHPLALTWAGSMLARDEEVPSELVSDWRDGGLQGLSDPKKAEHTLRWLFERSVRGLDPLTRQALAAMGVLARAPVPIEAVTAALDAPAAAARHALKVLVRDALLKRTSDEQWQFTHVLGYLFAREEIPADSEVRGRIAAWLKGSLSSALAGSAAASPVALLQHCAAVLRADSDRSLWKGLAKPLLYEFSDRLEEIGRLDLVGSALDACGAWLESVPGRTDDPYWVHEQSVLTVDRADVLFEQGDLAGALAAYEEAEGVSRRQAEGDPANAGWRRDLSVSRNKVGDVLRAQGDLAGALAAYEEAEGVRRQLAEGDPSNAVWQRDLSVSRERIGDVLGEQGDLAGALAAYEEAEGVRRRLAEGDPSNAGWQRDLSLSRERIGDVLRKHGDLAGALAAYDEAEGAIRRLAEKDPSNAGWQRDLSVSRNKVGDVLRAQGDLAGALAAYEEAEGVRRRLAEGDPSNAGWRRDLSFALTRLALVHEQRGDMAAALLRAEESLAINERLSALAPTNATWRRDVEFSRNLVARLRAGLSGS